MAHSGIMLGLAAQSPECEAPPNLLLSHERARKDDRTDPDSRNERPQVTPEGGFSLATPMRTRSQSCAAPARLGTAHGGRGKPSETPPPPGGTGFPPPPTRPQPSGSCAALGVLEKVSGAMVVVDRRSWRPAGPPLTMPNLIVHAGALTTSKEHHARVDATEERDDRIERLARVTTARDPREFLPVLFLPPRVTERHRVWVKGCRGDATRLAAA